MFGKQLKVIREEKRFSIEDLSKESGLSRQAIWAFETGKSEPKYSTVVAIAKALDISPSIFFEHEVKQTEQKEAS